MKIVHPKVILLAETSIVCHNDHDVPGGYSAASHVVKELGADGWSTDARRDGEMLIEMAGRMCYRSWKPGLNPNVTKVREGNREYMANILSHEHGSVLEHVTTTWALLNVARVFTHELVRHRVGTAISQESLRYVRLDDIPFAYTAELPDEICDQLLSEMEQTQVDLAQHFGLEDHHNFDYKKRKTSAMRRLAPMGLATNMIWTCNLRELRHIIELRTTIHAEEEIRKVIGMVAEIVIPRYPAVFQDFTKNESGEWVPKHRKV